MKIDAVKIDGRFRLCHGGTEEVVMVGPDNPADRFNSYLEDGAARLGEQVWFLARRAAHEPSGYTTKAAALRCAELMIEEGIVFLEVEE